MRKALLCVICVSLVVATACNDEYVTAKCVDNGIYSADFGPSRIGNVTMGIINTHRFKPGQVVELFPPVAPATRGTGGSIGTVGAESDLQSDNKPSDSSAVIASDFEIDGDATVQQFSAQIKTELQNNTKLEIKNGVRKAFASPLTLVGANASVKNQILAHPERLYLLVVGAVYADSIQLAYEKANSASASVNVIKVGKFNMHVSYSCSNITGINGVAGQPQPAVAFFYITLKASNGAVDTAPQVDLTQYDLSPAIM
jgi:hypothetical protein